MTAVASFWMVGSLFVSGVAWCLFRDTELSENSSTWRCFAAICALPSALGALMVYRYVPESPRFLAAKHDYSQAARSCNQMLSSLDMTADSTILIHHAHVPYLHPMNPKELESTHAIETNACRDEINTTQHSIFIQSIQALVETLGKLYSRQLLSQTTIPLQVLWFSLSFGTYGITTWINSLFVAVHLQNLYFNSFLFALANLPGNVICVLYSDSWGRKRMLVGSLLGAAGSLAGFASLVYFGGDSEQTNKSWLRTDAIVLFACAFQMFSIVSWNTIDIISGELFPTSVRSAGMGICTASGRMGAMVAQVANAKLMISSISDNDEEETTQSVASAWVLILASSALLFGALMPIFLGRDASGGELKDDVGDVTRNGSNIGCGGMWKSNKEHLSDEEGSDSNNVASSTKENAFQCVEYDSFRQEVEANQPFLL